jgi:rRNA-processing protein FCF1
MYQFIHFNKSSSVFIEFSFLQFSRKHNVDLKKTFLKYLNRKAFVVMDKGVCKVELKRIVRHSNQMKKDNRRLNVRSKKILCNVGT